jgi:hypothetical protein
MWYHVGESPLDSSASFGCLLLRDWMTSFRRRPR